MKIFEYKIWDSKSNKIYEGATRLFMNIQTGMGSSNLVLLPYINLSDKEGNKLYVGDIIEGHRNIRHTIFEVPGGYAIEGSPHIFGFHKEDDQFPVYDPTSDMQTSLYISESCIRIGNIYENPELITNSQVKLMSYELNKKKDGSK